MTKKIPIFKNYQEEAEFWDTHDVTDYLDDMKFVDVEFLPRQKKGESITIRLEPKVKELISKIATHRYRVSLSTIIRIWLIERLQAESIK